MKINVKDKSVKPVERNSVGVKVNPIGKEAQLVRSVLANMLWEGEFYENGASNAARIKTLVAEVSPAFVGSLAELARTKFKLRHVPLKLTRELARTGKLKANMLTNVIQRPDEIAEFLAIYWKEGKTPIANQVKKGLAGAFDKFNEFQLSKWDKNSASISLRDAMFLVHAHPRGRDDLFKRIANQEMGIADTWETQLSAGANKKETFTRLMDEGRLGALAFLRNLRNMTEAGISEAVIREYAGKVNVDKVLPFRYIAAARIVPQFENMLEEMMFRSLAGHEKLKGKTVLLVDISGSMFGTNVSAKSDLDRFDAAAALAMLCREICEDVSIHSFSERVVQVAPRRGFALRDAILSSQAVGGTYLGKALTQVRSIPNVDRIIVFTDEQSHDAVPFVGVDNKYIINVASYEKGIANGDWTTITGFSEAVIDYIQMAEEIGSRGNFLIEQ